MPPPHCYVLSLDTQAQTGSDYCCGTDWLGLRHLLIMYHLVFCVSGWKRYSMKPHHKLNCANSVLCNTEHSGNSKYTSRFRSFFPAHPQALHFLVNVKTNQKLQSCHFEGWNVVLGKSLRCETSNVIAGQEVIGLKGNCYWNIKPQALTCGLDFSRHTAWSSDKTMIPIWKDMKMHHSLSYLECHLE